MSNQPQLAASIILVGGSSPFPGLEDRLYEELWYIKGIGDTFRIIQTTRKFKKYATWIGGAKLSKLISTKESWITQDQFHSNSDIFNDTKSKTFLP